MNFIRELENNPEALLQLQQLLVASSSTLSHTSDHPSSVLSTRSSTLPTTAPPVQIRGSTTASAATKPLVTTTISKAVDPRAAAISSSSATSLNVVKTESMEAHMQGLKRQLDDALTEVKELRREKVLLISRLHRCHVDSYSMNADEWIDRALEQARNGTHVAMIKQEEDLPMSSERSESLPETRRGRRLEPLQGLPDVATPSHPISTGVGSASGSYRKRVPSERYTPRTPSLTQADKVMVKETRVDHPAHLFPSASASKSVGLNVSPFPAPVPISAAAGILPPRPQLVVTAHPSYTSSNQPVYHYAATPAGGNQPLRRRVDARSSPRPTFPDHHNYRSAAHVGGYDERRSDAPGRGGIGGSEAASRETSSVASSVRDPITMPKRNRHAGPATRSPSPVDPKRGPDMERRFVISNLPEDERERVEQAIRQLRQNATILDAQGQDILPDAVTHVVGPKGTPRSVKVLCGLVSSRWIVPPEYVFKSLEAGCWLDECETGGLRVYPPPLQHHRFLVHSMKLLPEQLNAFIQVIRFGGGEIVSPSERITPADGVVVFESPQHLLEFCMRGLK